MKIHKYGYQKLIFRPRNNPEDMLHILTLNKEDEVTCSNNIKQTHFGEIWTSKLHYQSFRQKKTAYLKLTNYSIRIQNKNKKNSLTACLQSNSKTPFSLMHCHKGNGKTVHNTQVLNTRPVRVHLDHFLTILDWLLGTLCVCL